MGTLHLVGGRSGPYAPCYRRKLQFSHVKREPYGDERSALHGDERDDLDELLAGNELELGGGNGCAQGRGQRHEGRYHERRVACSRPRHDARDGTRC